MRKIRDAAFMSRREIKKFKVTFHWEDSSSFFTLPCGEVDAVMASSTDRDKQASSSTKSAYPLTAFTRFIDESISNVLQSVVGLPSSLQTTYTWQPRMEAGQGEHPKNNLDGIHQRQADKTGDSVSSSDNNNGNSIPLQTPISKPSEFDEANIDFDRIHIPNPLPNDYIIPDDGIERSSANETLKRLKNYLDSSPYSPVHLEKDPSLQSSPYPFVHLEEDLSLQGHTPPWRSAFFDLMDVAQGGTNHPGISANLCLRIPNMEPQVWKSLFLKNFSYVYHQNSVQRLISSISAWPLEKWKDGRATLEKLIWQARDDDIAYQRHFYASIRELNLPNVPVRLVEDFMLAGDRRPFDDDYEARYLGRFPMTEALWKNYGFHWRLFKAAYNTSGPDLSFSDQRRPSIIDQMFLLRMRPKPDGISEQMFLMCRTRFSDGTMILQNRSDEYERLLRLEQPVKSTMGLFIDSHDAVTQTKVKKGGWSSR